MIRRVLYTLVLCLITGTLAYYYVKKQFIFRPMKTFFYQKEGYCSMDYPLNRLETKQEIVFRLINRMLLKPDHFQMVKSFKPRVSLVTVDISGEHLILDFNREFLKISPQKEEIILSVIMLGLYHNTEYQQVSILVNHRVLEKINYRYSYLDPIFIDDFLVKQNFISRSRSGEEVVNEDITGNQSENKSNEKIVLDYKEDVESLIQINQC